MVIRRGIKVVDFPRVPSAYGIPILMGGLEMSVDHSGYVAGAESNEESRDIAGPGLRKNKCMEYSSRHRTISADETMMDDVGCTFVE